MATYIVRSSVSASTICLLSLLMATRSSSARRSTSNAPPAPAPYALDTTVLPDREAPAELALPVAEATP